MFFVEKQINKLGLYSKADTTGFDGKGNCPTDSFVLCSDNSNYWIWSQTQKMPFCRNAKPPYLLKNAIKALYNNCKYAK